MPQKLSEREFALFRKLLKKKLGISCKPEKRMRLSRKLAPRLRNLGLASYDSYYRYLQGPEGGKELQNLINLVTVNQTSFFRGGRQFAFLREQIIPDIFRRKKRKRQIRIWCAGCSTGQEPYSLAMLVKEIVGMDPGWDIKILATDVDTATLKTAFRGLYSGDEVSPIPNTYLLKYFYMQKSENEKVFLVKDGLKEILAFRQHNLSQLPFPLKGPLDLILCRNVMIYFDWVMKEKIINEFHRLLGPEGCLCFGFSESLLGVEDRFAFMGCAAYRKTS